MKADAGIHVCKPRLEVTAGINIDHSQKSDYGEKNLTIQKAELAF